MHVIAVGAMRLANPDLVARLKADLPLNEPDGSTFYGGDEHGCTDCPTAQPGARLSHLAPGTARLASAAAWWAAP